MLESVGSLTGSPWIYAVVALSVLLDVFLPVLPSGVLVITAATAAAAGTTTAAGGSVQSAAGQRPARSALAPCPGPVRGHRLRTRRPRRVPPRLARRRPAGPGHRPLPPADQRAGTSRRGPQPRRRRPRRHRPLRPGRPLGRLAGRGRGPPQGQGVPALVGPGGRGLGRATASASATSAASGWARPGSARRVSVLALFAAGAGAAYVMRRPAEDEPGQLTAPVATAP